MSTSAARIEPPSRPSASSLAWSLPTRAVAAFSGPLGLILKIFFLGVVNAVAIWGGAILAGDGKWPHLAVLAAATVAIDAIYLGPWRALPAKFLVPGTIFLVAFQIVPIVYNVGVGFTNWSTGHIATKAEAIEGIKRNSLAPPADGKSYLMAPARSRDGDLTLILIDETTGEKLVGASEGTTPLPAGAVEVDEFGTIVRAEGYELVRGDELLALDQELAAFTVPTRGSSAIRAEGLSAALELEPTLRYDEAEGTFVRVSDGMVFRDNDRGSFVASNGEELEPGWRTNIGLSNFRAIGENPLIRKPFLRAFVWTMIFATAAVVLSFAFGLFLAIALDKPGMRFQGIYRSVLVVPYAIPSFLTLLVWKGLLNDEFGVINRALGLEIPWLFDPTWAKVSIILVSVWLTFPYFFLVSLGALQSIPGELVEAARVDGAGPWAVFRKITLPLLLVAVAPLMIASFAFNFNNFNNIFLLTGGGPPAEDQSVAGATDILITYTFKIAFESGKGQDFGLASAISIVIFFIVGTISAGAFWRSNSLENMR